MRTSGGSTALPSISGPSTPSGAEGSAEGSVSGGSADKGQASVWSHNVASRGRERNEVVEILKKEVSEDIIYTASLPLELTKIVIGVDFDSTSTSMYS